jgi:putative ABC transport system ATP-binding protein
MNDSATILKTAQLTKIYSTGRISVTALKGVNLTIEEGTFIGVTGASGSGKSTLMNLVGGLDTPTSGSIESRGKVISQMDKEDLARYRQLQVGMIFQSFNLIPSFSAWENVGLPLLFSGIHKGERRTRALEMLTHVGLAARQIHRPAELSGGEQQRVAIARALINHPQILLADEPTGNLDSGTSREIVQLISQLNKNRGLTVLMVSHEEALLQEFSDEIIRLRDGEVVSHE